MGNSKREKKENVSSLFWSKAVTILVRDNSDFVPLFFSSFFGEKLTPPPSLKSSSCPRRGERERPPAVKSCLQVGEQEKRGKIQNNEEGRKKGFKRDTAARGREKVVNGHLAQCSLFLHSFSPGEAAKKQNIRSIENSKM